jgi:hypothetical protein
MANDGYWKSSASDMTLEEANDHLYLTNSVEDFLNGKRFIVAEKGIGKTLMLKKKKYDFIQEQKGVAIPSDKDLDIPTEFNYLTKEDILLLEKIANTKPLWEISIQLSAIKRSSYFSDTTHSDEKLNRYPDAWNRIFDNSDELNTPSEIFNHISKDISKNLHHIRDYKQYLNAKYTNIKQSIWIFIDRLDQAMLISNTNVSEAMWHAMQIGLIEAAWDLSNHSHHVKVFCSIRQEAYDEYKSPVKVNLAGQICFLEYNENELHEIVNKLAVRFQRRTIEKIVGLGENGEFTHTKTGNKETVFHYMLRHTVAKPRDLILMASDVVQKFSSLTPEEANNKVETLRDTTNISAAKNADDIFTEKARFLECLRLEAEREKFFSLIPKNVLSRQSLISICQTFNEKKNGECNREQCRKDSSEKGCKHPFCELYNIGLLGYVRTDIPTKQVFKEHNESKVLHVTSHYDFYVVHPSLYKTIKEHSLMKDIRYIVTPGITTGKGCEWSQRDAQISDLIDLVLESGLPEDHKKGLMNDLKNTVKDTEDISVLHNQTKDQISTIKRKIIYNNKKVFLSYSWKNENETNQIDNFLRNSGMHVTRDKRDLKYKMDMQKFMKSINSHDLIVTLISDDYLKSENCMFEIGKLLRMKNYKNKTLQIIHPNAKIYTREGRREYIKYWSEERSKIEEGVKDIKVTEKILKNNAKEIKKIDEIIDNLIPFFDFISGQRGIGLEELMETNYEPLINHINLVFGISLPPLPANASR